MPEAIKRGEWDELHLIAAADYDDGDVLLLSGRPGVVEGPVLTGESFNFRTAGAYDVAMASATVVAAGVAIYFDDATKKAVVAGGGGECFLGVSDKAKAAGDLVIRVSIGQRPNPAAA
jgi:predicted RecA/RadA family phage recombinase